MKRLASSDSLPPLVTICPSTEEQSPRNKHVYGREFQSMLEGLDEEGCVEESGHHGEKKRRLSVEQVKALEKNFEVENKLEPDRKVKLAQELGLQPRQVAVWFQNRRARWKTKQLERDYGVLKANYEALKLNFDKVQQDNQALLKEIKELKSRVEEEKSESDASVKEERITVQESKKGEGEGEGEGMVPGSDDSKELNYEYECFSKCEEVEVGSLFAADTKDGFSDSDSSAILNDESPNNNNNNINNNNNNNNNISSSSCGGLQSHSLFVSPPSGSFQFHKQYYVKMEEHNLLSADEACNFFSDEQPPTLHWYCSDEWS